MKQFQFVVVATFSALVISGCASKQAAPNSNHDKLPSEVAKEEARIEMLRADAIAKEAAAQAKQPFILIDVPQVSDRRSAFDPSDSRPFVEPEFNEKTTTDFDTQPLTTDEPQTELANTPVIASVKPVYVPFPQAHRREPQPKLDASMLADPTANGAAATLREDYGQLAADVATAQFCQSHAYRNRARDRLVLQSQIDASKVASEGELHSAAGAFHGYLIGVRAAFNHYNAYLDNAARNKMCSSAASTVQKRLLNRKPQGSNLVRAEDVSIGKQALNSLPSSSSGLYPAHIAIAFSCQPSNNQNITALASIQNEVLANLDASLNQLQANPSARQWAKAAAVGQFRGIADAQIYYSAGQNNDGNKAMCDKAQSYVSNYLSHAKQPPAE